LKLLIEEAESDALASTIDRAQPDLVACWLLDTEMRRAAQRESALTQEMVSGLLDGVGLYEVPPSLFREAGVLPVEHVRPLDALHLAAAIRIGVDHVVTYDTRMGGSAQLLGARAERPFSGVDNCVSSGSAALRKRPHLLADR
jgi:predicted nucleic acid-binding protein